MPANPYWIGANLTCSLRFGLCPWRSSAPAAAYRRESRWSRWLPGVQWAWKLLRCNELCIYCNGKLTGCGSSCCDPRRGSASFFSFFQPVKYCVTRTNGIFRLKDTEAVWRRPTAGVTFWREKFRRKYSLMQALAHSGSMPLFTVARQLPVLTGFITPKLVNT